MRDFDRVKEVGMKQESEERRAEHRKKAPMILTNAGVRYFVHNGGAHLVVEERIDFWPGTGKWIDRESGRKGRGVFSLIKHVRKNV